MKRRVWSHGKPVRAGSWHWVLFQWAQFMFFKNEAIPCSVVSQIFQWESISLNSSSNLEFIVEFCQKLNEDNFLIMTSNCSLLSTRQRLTSLLEPLDPLLLKKSDWFKLHCRPLCLLRTWDTFVPEVMCTLFPMNLNNATKPADTICCTFCWMIRKSIEETTLLPEAVYLGHFT